MYEVEPLLTESNHFLFFKLNQSIDKITNNKVKQQLSRLRDLIWITCYGFLNNRKSRYRRFSMSFKHSFIFLFPFVVLALLFKFVNMAVLTMPLILVATFVAYQIKDRIKHKVETEQEIALNVIVAKLFNDNLQVSRNKYE